MKYVTVLATGIIIGILVAPAKGSKTRRKLAGKFDDLKDKSEDLIDDVKSAFNTVKKDTKELLG